MAETTVVEPDVTFIRNVIARGGRDLKKCFQCATCSTVCSLSPEDAPFPRKQMIEAQWGMKEKLAADPAIWLCHNCGDCTKNCPRGARPGDVIGALRSEAIRHFAFPRFMGDLVACNKTLPFLFLLPALIFLAIAFWAPKGAPTQEFEFANVFPIPVLEGLFFTVAGLALAGFVVSIARFIGALRAAGANCSTARGLWPALMEIAKHERFTACDAKYWRIGHMLAFWGFAGLAVVGTAAGIGTMTGLLHTPLALAGRLKILANVSALAMLAGTVMLLTHRLKNPLKRVGSTYFDWFFLLTITGVVITGILSEVLRLAQLAAWMYSIYYVHLVLIFALFLYAPYSKFAHLAYRTVAMAACGPWKAKAQCTREPEAEAFPAFQ